MDTALPSLPVPARLGFPSWPALLDVRRAPHSHDQALPEHEVEVYDAHYAWCRHARGETHGWNPEAMQ